MYVPVRTHTQSKLYANGNQDLANSLLSSPASRGGADGSATSGSGLEEGSADFSCKVFSVNMLAFVAHKVSF